MKIIDELIKEHHFFKNLDDSYIKVIAGCGTNVIIKEGEYVAREGEEANEFFLIRKGKVAIDILDSTCGSIVIQTLEEGEIFGWSWIIAPHFWHFNARAVETTHAVSLDGKCLREKCEQDNTLGYHLLKRFSGVLAKRLEMARMQLLDVYGAKVKKDNFYA